ncbi:phage tail protein [Shewanella surugensis]|uniref:Phage tail protein n=1 Tax=Shewanella surugensis TaxID=212020 RepID=A0ABT0L8X7_9GAMM|nr:phage tail protein [Shewanella surugensis]MCL1124158.1 phage tail protein [Shewanella surugensis]
MEHQQTLFPLDFDEFEAARLEFGATEKQMRIAYDRALSRTLVTVRKLSRQFLCDELQARRIKDVQRRMKVFKLKKAGKKTFNELKLWFGLNDMSVGALKGRKTQHSDGAAFSSSSRSIGSKKYKGGFVTNRYGNRSIFIRKDDGRFPILDQKITLSEDLEFKIEDQIFAEIPDIFFKYYFADLKYRVTKK